VLMVAASCTSLGRGLAESSIVVWFMLVNEWK